MYTNAYIKQNTDLTDTAIFDLKSIGTVIWIIILSEANLFSVGQHGILSAVNEHKGQWELKTQWTFLEVACTQFQHLLLFKSYWHFDTISSGLIWRFKSGLFCLRANPLQFLLGTSKLFWVTRPPPFCGRRKWVEPTCCAVILRPCYLSSIDVHWVQAQTKQITADETLHSEINGEVSFLEIRSEQVGYSEVPLYFLRRHKEAVYVSQIPACGPFLGPYSFA